MEPVIVIIVSILALPYLAYGWLYGLSLLKNLFENEWRKQKGLLRAYENLTPEQRMEGELKRIVLDEGKGKWLEQPTPKEAEKFEQEVIVKVEPEAPVVETLTPSRREAASTTE